ncbi:hypothetical protein FHG64_10165 [Antarcticibacterium flavum]|uniref:Uncharacterized protein n=1 Tax=Antarcticibacterium flavum TaxID=2058175 RepID=A0A5B7X530_9FLAO|nr:MULTISPECIES: hypothetical protein [Antarcticibacterium]MCM4160608.1 hypothetical protein [Antarcticibacterium sp. W02-3]QCY69733.1 hypothetical protein FHG64_10165 [Antarcticibacterium flavum]
MDTASATIGIVLILLFVCPVAYIIWQQAAKNKKRLQQLKLAEKQFKIKLDTIDLTPSLLLGLDSAAKKLVVINTLHNSPLQVVDLKKVHRSSVKKVAVDEVKENKNPSCKLVSLELLNGHPGNTTSIVFYDEEEETGFDVETQLALANKWDTLIKGHLQA